VGPFRSLVRPAVVAVALVVGYYVLPLQGWAGPVSLALLGAFLVAMLPLAVRRARRVRTSSRPLLEAVGALAILVTGLIVAFAALYYLMATRWDGQLPAIETRTDSLYFTVSTLSTVGFGDIVATGQAARVVVTVNILFNVVIAGTAIRLVGGAAQRRLDQPSA
jgi:hypothetical protein